MPYSISLHFCSPLELFQFLWKNTYQNPKKKKKGIDIFLKINTLITKINPLFVTILENLSYLRVVSLKKHYIILNTG